MEIPHGLTKKQKAQLRAGELSIEEALSIDSSRKVDGDNWTFNKKNIVSDICNVNVYIRNKAVAYMQEHPINMPIKPVSTTHKKVKSKSHKQLDCYDYFDYDDEDSRNRHEFIGNTSTVTYIRYLANFKGCEQ